MSLVVPGMARSEVNTNSMRKSSRKKICEVLRNFSHWEPVTHSSARRA
jgi:hypothetical protein